MYYYLSVMYSGDVCPVFKHVHFIVGMYMYMCICRHVHAFNNPKEILP